MTTELRSKPVVDHHLQDLKQECEQLKAKGVNPSLKIILVGDDPASQVYTNLKKKFCAKWGADCEIVKLAADVSKQEFLDRVEGVVQDPAVHGVIIQVPVPEQLKGIDLEKLIPPEKDVDGFHFQNVGSTLKEDGQAQTLTSCTPKGIITLLDFYQIPIEGKHAVVIGRSMIVGKPLACLLINRNATVTVCHSRTKNLAHFTKQADLIFCAIGKAKFLNSDHIGSNNPVVVDVGTNQLPNGKLCGDVDYDSVYDQVSAISPVPGGVGPLTILTLAQNLLQAAKNSLV